METIKGDLIKLAQAGEFDVIVHGCNCFNTMGAGIAKQIKQIWPKAYEVDKKTRKGDKGKLGSYTKTEIIQQLPDGGGYKVHDLIIVNAYTQYDYRHTDGPPVDYGAIKKVFAKINQDFKGKKVGIPMIGAGLAGGEWGIIESIIDAMTRDLDITVVEFAGFQHRS